MPLRLAVLVSHPIPHFAPWHREVARKGEIGIKVFFSSDLGVSEFADPDFGTSFRWDVPLTEGYEHEFPPDAAARRGHSFSDLDFPGLPEALDRYAPDVVQTFGYTGRRFPRLVRWARSRRRPLMLYSDAHLSEHDESAAWRGWVRELILPVVYRCFDGAQSVGDNNREYHRHFGMPEERIFDGCLPIDRTRLMEPVADRAEARRRVRERHGIPESAFVALFCGKLIPRKRPLDLVRAVAPGSEAEEVWTLLVGEGPQRAEIAAAVESSGQRNTVLAGFVNQSAISEYLVASDVLAVPSERDPHPLVVTEADAFGLPVIVSDAIGCVGRHDTARPDVNALVFPCGSVDGLAKGLARLANEPDTWRRMSQAGLSIADGQDAEAAAVQLAEATRALHELGPR